jgi:neutral ceramidase
MLTSGISKADEEFYFKFGIGKADITGFPADAPFPSWGPFAMKSVGIHMRQWARAFIIENAKTGERVVYVNCDTGAMSFEIRQRVLAALADKKNSQGKPLYTNQNVMITATHAHSTPGLAFGTGNGGVAGIVNSILRAHDKMMPGRLFYGTGDLTNASANRALIPFGMNKLSEEDKIRYKRGIDPEVTVLKFVGTDGKTKGAISWFAVHATSMGFRNALISPDNKGYAEYYWEKVDKSDPEKDSQFIAAFAQTNPGDVSPNLNILATPPGQPTLPPQAKDGFTNTKKIGGLQAAKAIEIAAGPGMKEVTASASDSTLLESAYEFINMAAATVDVKSLQPLGEEERQASTPNLIKRTCPPAIGLASIEGSTEDGGGITDASSGNLLAGLLKLPLLQNVLKLGLNLITVSVRDEERKCQAEKDILVNANKHSILGTIATVAGANIDQAGLPIQMFRIGQLVLLGAPNEITVISGAAIRREVAKAFVAKNVTHVILNGYANGYNNYVTTREEYKKQEYEGASTVFGPWEQKAFMRAFRDMANNMVHPAVLIDKIQTLPEPAINAKAKPAESGVWFDNPVGGRKFGDVLKQPKARYKAGETVVVEFVTGHPNNNIHHDDSFLKVFYNGTCSNAATAKRNESKARPVADDDDWETIYRWQRIGLSASKALISWDIPANAASGCYFISHSGDWKNGWNGKITGFTGLTNLFKVE